MDTWATSSLTPQIAGHAGEDEELFEKVFPMDVRPQAHDIIRTWLFTTMLRSQLDEDELPWANAAISGWVLDPDRKKMSKSKGNVVTPMHLLEEHGADAVRYWAASGRPGTDTAFDSKQMKVGTQLAVKLLNASKFALAELPPPAGELAHPLDRAMIARLGTLVAEAERVLRGLRLRARAAAHRGVLLVVLRLLPRARQGPPLRPRRRRSPVSVSRALRLSLSVFQRLFAPFLPFVCEEVWSWWQEGSVHRAPWPGGGRAERARRPRAASGELRGAGPGGDRGQCCARCARRSRRRARRCARRSRRVLVRDTARAPAGARARRRATCARQAIDRAGRRERPSGRPRSSRVEVELGRGAAPACPPDGRRRRGPRPAWIGSRRWSER